MTGGGGTLFSFSAECETAEERVRETVEERGGDIQMRERERERDQERLLKLHQAQGKSNQAISKPRRCAPATLAPHNYNTI